MITHFTQKQLTIQSCPLTCQAMRSFSFSIFSGSSGCSCMYLSLKKAWGTDEISWVFFFFRRRSGGNEGGRQNGKNLKLFRILLGWWDDENLVRTSASPPPPELFHSDEAVTWGQGIGISKSYCIDSTELLPQKMMCAGKLTGFSQLSERNSFFFSPRNFVFYNELSEHRKVRNHLRGIECLYQQVGRYINVEIKE